MKSFFIFWKIFAADFWNIIWFHRVKKILRSFCFKKGLSCSTWWKICPRNSALYIRINWIYFGNVILMREGFFNKIIFFNTGGIKGKFIWKFSFCFIFCILGEHWFYSILLEKISCCWAYCMMKRIYVFESSFTFRRMNVEVYKSWVHFYKKAGDWKCSVWKISFRSVNDGLHERIFLYFSSVHVNENIFSGSSCNRRLSNNQRKWKIFFRVFMLQLIK